MLYYVILNVTYIAIISRVYRFSHTKSFDGGILMLQNFMLVDSYESERSQLKQVTKLDSLHLDSKAELTSPLMKLSHLGFRVHTLNPKHTMDSLLHGADAVVLSVLPEAISDWRQQVSSLKSVPILWWCDQFTFPSSECKLDMEIDGMLCSGMNASEIHCTLLLAFNRSIQRMEWQQEREQLKSRLEERKWIERAKQILCEIKHISEAEAYDFLRKQAMNERKRLVDVATSIVKVYQLLQDNNKGGRTR